MSKPRHFLMSASPIRPVPITAMVLPEISSPRKGKNGCQAPHFCSRTIFSLSHRRRASAPIIRKVNSRGRVIEDLRGVGERDFVAIGVSPVDVVKPDRNLGYDFQR